MLDDKNKLKEFIENQKQSVEKGFWKELPYSGLINCVALQYDKEVLGEYYIADIIVDTIGVLVKWEKRKIPLTDSQLKEKYNK